MQIEDQFRHIIDLETGPSKNQFRHIILGCTFLPFWGAGAPKEIMARHAPEMARQKMARHRWVCTVERFAMYTFWCFEGGGGDKGNGPTWLKNGSTLCGSTRLGRHMLQFGM